MENFKILMKRELNLAFSNLTSTFAYSTFFFLALLIFVFSVGPNLEALSYLHISIVWVIILFGLILISENFIFEDFYDGSLRELQFLGYSGELIFITKSIVMFSIVLNTLHSLPARVLADFLVGLWSPLATGCRLCLISCRK